MNYHTAIQCEPSVKGNSNNGVLNSDGEYCVEKKTERES